MLTSISPFGEWARANRWWLTIFWLTAGAAIGGAAVGAALGTVGQVILVMGDERWPPLALAGAGIAAAAWDLTGRRFPGHRQVNEDWLSMFRPWVYGLGYGLQLGAAVTTVVNTALVPIWLLAALLIRDTRSGLVMGVAFGMVRGLSVTMNYRVRTVVALRELHRRMDGMADQARLMGALAAVLLAMISVLGVVI